MLDGDPITTADLDRMIGDSVLSPAVFGPVRQGRQQPTNVIEWQRHFPGQSGAEPADLGLNDVHINSCNFGSDRAVRGPSPRSDVRESFLNPDDGLGGGRSGCRTPAASGPAEPGGAYTSQPP